MLFLDAEQLIVFGGASPSWELLFLSAKRYYNKIVDAWYYQSSLNSGSLASADVFKFKFAYGFHACVKD